MKVLGLWVVNSLVLLGILAVYLAYCSRFPPVGGRLILAMGRFAVQALLRTDEAIGRLRGRVHRYQGVPLIVTYHPAYLLRNVPDKARAWEDLCLALETMESVRAPG